MSAMRRKLVWVERRNFQGFGCSACSWVFKPSGAFVDGSLDEMKNTYEAQRDNEFAVHICVKHQMPAGRRMIESQHPPGFGCSECSWKFRAAGPLVGDSLDQMKKKYEAKRDKEFAAHVCAKHPRARTPRIE
jgi:hypothetical protein